MSKMPDLSRHAPELILDGTCRRSAVCIPLLEKEDGVHVLFELQPGSMAENAGDICFPGGMLEPGEDAGTAAVRELREELLLSGEQVELLGRSDTFHNLAVLTEAFVVRLKGYAGTFNSAEVKRVFTVPLRTLLDTEPESFPMEWTAAPGADFPYDRVSGGRAHKWRRQRYRQVFYPTPYGYIWGITGKLLEAFLKLVREEEPNG